MVYCRIVYNEYCNLGHLKQNICASELDLNMERLPVELTVVRSQPGPVSDGQWSTGLCECWGDMGDCEYSSSSGMPYTVLI